MTEPTDAELKAMWRLHAADIGGIFCYARAVLAKWGQPAQAAEPFGYVNTYTGQFYKDVEPCRKNNEGHWRTVFTSQQPTQTQPVAREPQWCPASTPPKESDGEVLVRMADGRCEIAWATYWHGSSNAFAQWTFRDPDEEETPVEWMLIPHDIKGGQHGTE